MDVNPYFDEVATVILTALVTSGVNKLQAYLKKT